MSEKLSLPSIKDLLEGGPGLIDYSSSSRNQQHQKQKSYLHRHRRHASEHITSSTNYSRHNILPPPPIPSITASSSTTNRTNYTPLTSTTAFINNDDTNISKQSTTSSITAPSSTQQDTIRFSLPHEMQQLSLEKSPKEIMSLKNLLPSSRNRTHSRSYSDFTHNYASSITIRPFPSKLSTMNESRSSSTANTLPVLLPNPNTTTNATEDKEEKVAISSDNQESTTHARYVCPYCKKGFTRPSSLRTHTYSHTGEKPFVCTEPCCGKKFSVQSNLRRHLRIHRLNKPTTLFLPKNIN